MSGKLLLYGLLAICGTGTYLYYDAAAARLQALLDGRAEPPGTTRAIQPTGPLAEHCSPGRITVFVFLRDGDPACRPVVEDICDLCRVRPDVAVRLISFDGDWSDRRYLAQHSIALRSVPHVEIYDRQGGRIAADSGNIKRAQKLLSAWVEAERRRAAQPTVQPWSPSN